MPWRALKERVVLYYSLMTRTQKCLALTAVALVAVVSPVVAISALTFPVFGGSVNQNVRQLSFDGASLQEQDENGVISGTCSYEDESGRTVEISYTKSQYGTVNANSPGVRDPYAAYQACIQRVEELKRQQLEEAGVYNEGATQSPSGRDVGTPSSSPSLSGTASQSSPSRNNPGQIQMVFQTSGGNSMQFQENASMGVTTGQCAYVDWRGRTIKISYTKHANGKVDVVTDPEVWQPKRAYHTCISKAKEESKRLDSKMAQIESDLRQTEREVQSEIARQEEEAFGRGNW